MPFTPGLSPGVFVLLEAIDLGGGGQGSMSRHGHVFVIVVPKDSDIQPGPGFFHLAK